MIGRLIHLCEQASSVVGTLPATEQADARRLLELCQTYAENANEQTPGAEARVDEAFTRDLSRMVEYLARRHAHGIPLATLGRAVLAHQSAHYAFYVTACAEAEQNLTLLGF